ncbi:helix-turn-helix domain-containing protein [Paraburkholderia sediminicola]|uniref:helix-turn-helix domain-containing protein n=1 Tax=Paraburkholderia sediminicola TaxID=458836 RepID=UPI0038BB21D2
MAGRKSAEVTEAVALVVSGKCGVHKAARKTGVAPSSVYRDAAYKKWAAAQKEAN